MISKKELRIHLKSVRKFNDETEKKRIDNLIADRFLNSEIFRNSDSVLIYVSYGSEIDTYGIIRRAFADNKTVAVPYCNGDDMKFYKFNARDEFISGAFGIPTVNTENSLPFVPDNNTLCIVPGLGFDLNGNRIGYGGGYYDRYLCDKSLKTAAPCYEKCLVDHVPAENHDKIVDFIFTENRMINVRR